VDLAERDHHRRGGGEDRKAGLVVRDFDYKGWDNLSTV
jgi:hypothetical protein